MMYVRFPFSLCNVEYLLHERGVDVSYENVRAWWNRFGPLFASEIRKSVQDHVTIGHDGAGNWTMYSSE